MQIGFIGQGWIGKHLADHFETRGFATVRYAKEPMYEGNVKAIADCDIVFIAVPTPTTPGGFDDSVLRSVIPLVGKGKVAVIKSTVLPGTTDSVQKENPDILVLHSPEFLRETSVKHDIDYPDRNIIGIPTAHMRDRRWKVAAKQVMHILPPAPYKSICRAVEAEITKYGGNNFLYTKVVFMNMLYDLSKEVGARFDIVADNLKADPRIGSSHMQAVHQHEHMGIYQGRGAGGHCFIKDFAAFRAQYEKLLAHDAEAIALLRAFEAKNNSLLKKTKKDIDLLRGVYGDAA
jgi:UDPglucose 6-dehydrogenase